LERFTILEQGAKKCWRREKGFVWLPWGTGETRPVFYRGGCQNLKFKCEGAATSVKIGQEKINKTSKMERKGFYYACTMKCKTLSGGHYMQPHGGKREKIKLRERWKHVRVKATKVMVVGQILS